MKTSKTIIFSSLVVATMSLSGCSDEKDNNLNSIGEIKNNTSQVEAPATNQNNDIKQTQEPVLSENKNANKGGAKKLEQEENINSTSLPTEGIEMKSIGEKLASYTNYGLGFKFIHPTINYEENVSIRESGDVAFLLYDNYSKKDFEKINSNDSDFKKIRGFTFAFIVKDIKNESELKKFLQNKYGENCTSFEKVESSKEGVFDIKVKNTAKSLDDESGCMVNYATWTKYSPQYQKVISWDGGQDCSFEDCAVIKTINDSVEFIKK